MDTSGEEKKTISQEKMMPIHVVVHCYVQGKRRRRRPRRKWLENTLEDMKKYEMTADMTENREPVLEYDGLSEDWPTKMWRWSLKARNVRKQSTSRTM